MSEPQMTEQVEQLFYIQNSRGCVGDCLLFWREGGHGYTCNLEEAWAVERMQALDICRSRPGEDIPRRKADMDRIAERHVRRGCSGGPARR